MQWIAQAEPVGWVHPAWWCAGEPGWSCGQQGRAAVQVAGWAHVHTGAAWHNEEIAGNIHCDNRCERLSLRPLVEPLGHLSCV